MERLNLNTIKNFIGSIPGDNKEIKKISSTELGVVLSDREYEKYEEFLLKLMVIFGPWGPKKEGMSVTVQGIKITVKKRSHQRKPKKRYDGFKNEIQFHEYLSDAIRDCPDNLPLNVHFSIKGVPVFSVMGVRRVERVGRKDVFQLKKADEHLILQNGKRVPISLKKEDAAGWESGDRKFRELAEKFWKWGKKQGYITHSDHPDKLIKRVDGVDHKVQKINREIAFRLRQDLAKETIFGTDIIAEHGAVVVITVNFDKISQDGNDLYMECKHVFRKMEDIPEEYYPHLLLRNDQDRILNKGKVIPAGIRLEIVTRSIGGRIGRTQRVLIVNYAH